MQQTDPRPEKMKREMAQHFDEYETDYRDANWCSIVYEDDEVALIADHKGYEFSEWGEEFPDHQFSETMHTLAEQIVDRTWSADYPVVFDKLE